MGRWGDDEEEAFTKKESAIDSKGYKTVTEFNLDAGGRRVKVTSKIKVVKETIRIPKRVAFRAKNWKRFGSALSESKDDSNVTIVSKLDDIRIEDPNADVVEVEDTSKLLGGGNLNAFWAKQQRRQLERKYDVDSSGADAPEGGEGGGENTDGKYVPPSSRTGAANAFGGKSLEAMAATMPEEGAQRFDDRDQNTIRVTNISEDTTEADLQELFNNYGRISRVYLAKDRETMQSRGFAFISFMVHEDAQRAMEKLQGFGYDHLILKLEWARPSGGTKDAGAETTTFRSGYGKALAQDTKEKVSFASNLTR